jgi:hypothetical protein
MQDKATGGKWPWLSSRSSRRGGSGARISLNAPAAGPRTELPPLGQGTQQFHAESALQILTEASIKVLGFLALISVDAHPAGLGSCAG